jgi:hypothetical protein
LVCHFPGLPIAAGIGWRNRTLPVWDRVCGIRNILAVLLRSRAGAGRVKRQRARCRLILWRPENPRPSPRLSVGDELAALTRQTMKMIFS